MTAGRIFDLLGSIVAIAMVTAILLRGSAAAQVIRALGDAFNGAVGAAIAG